MKQSLDRFILRVPYVLLKKVLYIYVGAVIFWESAPSASIVLWGIVLATLLLIGYQSRARIAGFVHKYSSDGDVYMEKMRGPFSYWWPRLFVALNASALTGYCLNGQFGLKSVQIFFLAVGYVIFYRETGVFGAFVVYIITDRGIGINYIPSQNLYQTFINFTEIKSITMVRDNDAPSPSWTSLAPYNAATGLLLNPANPDGFSAHDRLYFIAPKNISKFISRLPVHIKVIGQPPSHV